MLDVIGGEPPPVASQCWYVVQMPSGRPIFGAQPSDVILLTSRSFRGVPSGRLVSKLKLPW
jgi:hypothetical protein